VECGPTDNSHQIKKHGWDRIGHWSIHGLTLGALFSLPLAFSSFMVPDDSQMSGITMFFMTIVLGMIYGLLIELITTVFFKAPNQAG